jgi:hypothetical protein
MVASTVSFAELEDAIRADYDALCRQFGLHAVPLDIYVVDEASSARTGHGTQLKNATPAYNGRLIIIPVEQGDLNVLYDLQNEYPPKLFEVVAWQPWRVELWHEVAHQLQDQKLNKWNKNDDADGHALGWNEALDLLGSPFGVSGAKLKRFL